MQHTSHTYIHVRTCVSWAVNQKPLHTRAMPPNVRTYNWLLRQSVGWLMHSAPTTTAHYPSKQPALHVMLESPALPHCTHYTCTHSDIPHHVHMYVCMAVHVFTTECGNTGKSCSQGECTSHTVIRKPHIQLLSSTDSPVRSARIVPDIPSCDPKMADKHSLHPFPSAQAYARTNNG